MLIISFWAFKNPTRIHSHTSVYQYSKRPHFYPNTLKMRAIVISAALLGAGALAHPHVKPQHQHLKRDREIAHWQENGVLYEKFEKVETVVLPPGGSPPSSATSSAASFAPTGPGANAQAKLALNGNSGGNPGGNGPGNQGPWGSNTLQNNGQAPSPTPQVQAQTPTPQTQIAPSPQGNANPTSAAPSTNTGTTSSGSCNTANQIGGSAADWASPPCSGGKNILDSFNTIRGNWNATLKNSPLQWKAVLAQNSRTTAWSPQTCCDSKGNKQNEGEAVAMGHYLYDGSSAQAEAPGDGVTTSNGVTPFEQALKTWLCEMSLGDCPAGKTTTLDYNVAPHAVICASYAYVGCYYMNANNAASGSGIWTCDFTNG